MPKVYETRLVAFLDVLGFSRQLETGRIENLHQAYANFIDLAKTATFFRVQGDNEERTNFAFSQFLFDFIVLVSNETKDIRNVNNFISAVSLLLEIGFLQNMPLRGAIGYGDFLLDDDRNIFLSGVFPEIVRAEKQQEWTGCIVCASAQSVVVDAVFGSTGLPQQQVRNQLIHRFSIPTKSHATEGICLNFLVFLPEADIRRHLAFLNAPKQAGLLSYFEFLLTLPLALIPVDPSMSSARWMMNVTTRSGIRFIFFNDAMERCEPSAPYALVASGRWYE